MKYIKKLTSDKIKSQIRALHENNDDWKPLARALGIKSTTVYRWISGSAENDKQRGGRRNLKILPDHKSYIQSCVEESSKITLKELKFKLHDKYQVDVSIECLRKHLDGLLFKLKDIRFEPERANCLSNKVLRKLYAEKLLNCQAENIQIIYLDKTNFNLLISRTKGISKKVSRFSDIAAGSRGANIYVIGCIGNIRLIHHEVRRGAFKKEDAMEFVRNCLRKAENLYHSKVILVLDNAPCHSAIETVFQETEFIGHQLLRLGPYSPQFNAIEYSWSSLKSDVKRDLNSQIQLIIIGDGIGDITQTEHRLQCLETIITNNLNTVTVDKCMRYIAYIQRFLPEALNMNDINF